jgi:hypothetical protein
MEGQNGKSWNTDGMPDLRVTFDIKKTGDMNPNEAEISICNLSKQSREFIKEKMVIILDAGYIDKNLHGQLFKGQIAIVNEGREGTDWIVTVNAKDSLKEVRDTYVSHSFSEKTDEGDVIRWLANKLNVTIGSLRGLGLSKRKYNHGRALSGNAMQKLNELCKTNGLKAIIADGVLHIIPVNESINSTAIRLDESSGLIGSPERIEKGYKVMSLLRYEINPGTLIDIKSRRIAGPFKAFNVNHVGDTHGTSDAWKTIIEAQPA